MHLLSRSTPHRLDLSRSTRISSHLRNFYIAGLATTSAPTETVTATPSGRETGVGQEIKAGRDCLGDDCGEGSAMLPQAGVEPSVKPFADEVGEQGRRPDAREPPLSNAGALEAPPPPVAGGKLSLVSASAAAAAAAAAEAAEANRTAPSSTAAVNGITQSITAEEPAGAIMVAERVVSEGGGALVQAESRQVSLDAVWRGAVRWSRPNLARSVRMLFGAGW